MANHLLILHNGTSPDGAQLIAQRFEQAGLHVSTLWASNGQFPISLDEYDGCFLTGSPHGAYEEIEWIEREHEVILQMAAANMPMLGVCFGSQILASALCGRAQVFRRPTCEVGYMTLPLTDAGQADALTAPLGEAVDMFVWHNDEVRADHPDMIILADSADCPNQIWRYRNQPIWGIQGHPELTRTSAIALFEAEEAIFEQDGANIDQLKADAHDAPEAKIMLERFAEIVLIRP